MKRDVAIALACIVAGVALIPLALALLLDRKQVPQEPSSIRDAALACEAAHEFVAARLVAPAAARFPDCSGLYLATAVTASKDGSKWAVNGEFDAPNRLGVLLRSEYSVTMARYQDEFAPIAVDVSDR